MRKKQKGQAAVEYLLMVAVAITLGLTFKEKMTDYFLRNPNSFINAYLRNFQRQFDSNGRYKTFRVIQAGRRNR